MKNKSSDVDWKDEMEKEKGQLNIKKNINSGGHTSYIAWIHKHSYPCSLQNKKTQKITILLKREHNKTSATKLLPLIWVEDLT